MIASSNTSITDPTFAPLLPYLQYPDRPTLWLADENALTTLATLESNHKQYLYILTNRYDIYQLAIRQGIQAEFSDFLLESLPARPERIIYRISKEKPVVHHVLNQAAMVLHQQSEQPHNPVMGEFIIAGKKQEGIKTYGEKLSQQMQCHGKLKKSGNTYSGCFTHFHGHHVLDDKNYRAIQPIIPQRHAVGPAFIYSKPGVFGWNKVDEGTQLLLHALGDMISTPTFSPKTILDLGCGYGWIFASLASYLPRHDSSIHITATDNNAAALLCAEKNAEEVRAHTQWEINIIASDCANTISDSFELILCNPPFHRGFSHDKSLTGTFLQQTVSHLHPTGVALWVVNEFIPLPRYVKAQHHDCHCREIKREGGFTVYCLHRHS